MILHFIGAQKRIGNISELEILLTLPNAPISSLLQWENLEYISDFSPSYIIIQLSKRKIYDFLHEERQREKTFTGVTPQDRMAEPISVTVA